MSVVYPLKDFDTEKAKQIDEMLTFTSVERKQYNRNQFFSAPEPSIQVKMYYTENGNIHLPYRFSCAFNNKICNQDIEFPKLYEDKKGKFAGNLLPRQVEPYNQGIKHIKKYRTTTIALYPGFGKTFMGARYTWHLNMYTCVLVHRDNVGKQWVKTFQKYFPELQSNELWYVDDKVKQDAKILVCMAGRTDKIPDELKQKIGTLIIDEAHCFCSSSRVKPLLSFTPKYTIAETATPVKDNGMHKMIQSICGTHYIRKISEKPYNFYIINTQLEYEDLKKGDYGALVNKQCDSRRRNEIIMSILKENTRFKTIVATLRKTHVEYIQQELEKENMECSTLYGTKKNYKTKNILIGTGSKMGVGFDEANFCDDFDGRPSDLLIMCYTMASWANFEQVRGRGMRADKPNVVIFNDKSSISKKHMTQIRKWVKETNGNIIELNVAKMDNFRL